MIRMDGLQRDSGVERWLERDCGEAGAASEGGGFAAVRGT